MAKRLSLLRQWRTAVGSAMVTRRRVARLLRLVLVSAVIAVIVVTAATAGPSACRYGVSSIGPVTLTHGHLSGDTKPYTQACLP